MFGVSEVLTRMVWTEQEVDPCSVRDDMGNHHKANCTVRMKNAEAQWVTYHYNECGYRSATSCGTKPPGSARIATLGASVSMGLYIPYEEAYFSLTSSELSRICNRIVDVQNVEGTGPINVYRKLQEVLALKPDVVLYLVSPFDLEQQIDPKELAERDNPARTPTKTAAKPTLSPMKWLERTLTESRTVLVYQRFLFQNTDIFLRLYMTYGDNADLFRQPLTPAWQRRFAHFDLIIGDMAAKLRAAGVPLVIIAVPSRPEAALLSSKQLPPNVDPFAFGRQIEMIASRQGAGYVDLVEAFSHISNSENLFYVVNGHVTPEGQIVIAKNIVQKLQDGSVPAFSHCALSQSAPEEH
jgi:hypothetical protein